MSLTFPTLPGQTPVVKKNPNWGTVVKRTASGRERRTETWAYPIWEFEVSFEVIRDEPGVYLAASPITDGTGAAITDGEGGDILDGPGIALDEQSQLWEMFNLSQGKCGTWIYLDPTDNAVSAAPIGTGDGTTTTFQFYRAINSWVEPVQSVLGPTVYDNGSEVTDYAISGGTITFSTAPAAGHVLTWTGQFQFVCRFDEDELPLDQIVSQLWEGQSVTFTTFHP